MSFGDWNCAKKRKQKNRKTTKVSWTYLTFDRSFRIDSTIISNPSIAITQANAMIPWSQLANKNLHQYFAMILQLKHISQIGPKKKKLNQIK